MTKGYLATEIRGQCSMCLAGIYPNTVPVLELISERMPSAGTRVCRKCGEALRDDLNEFLKDEK
jgi:hypothetical protein